MTSQSDPTKTATATIELQADSISSSFTPQVLANSANLSPGINSISGTMSPQASGSGATVALSGAAPVLVQSAPGSSGIGSSSGVVSFSAPSASGDTIVLFLRFGGATILGVSDNQPGGSNTYTSVLGPTQWGVAPNSTDRSAQVFVANNIKGGSILTIAVTLSGSSTHDTYMAALEYSGVDPINPINATSVGTGTNGRTPATANVTTTVANTKLVATSWDSNESYTSSGNGTGYTTDVSAGILSISGGSGWSNLTEDRTATAAGTWNATASSSPAVNDWIVQMVALTPASFQTVVGDANGNYAFSGLPNGTYSVTPSKSGSTFSPPSQTVAVSGNVTGINFTDTTAKFSIFGKVNQAVSGSGAILTLTAAAPVLVQSASDSSRTGNSSGTISFSAPSASGNTIVLFVRFGGTTISQVTDNRPGGSNTYTSVLGPTPWGTSPNSTDRSAQVFVATNVIGGSALTISVTLAGSTTHNMYMVALEYSGVDRVKPINATAVGTGAVRINGSPATASLTTTVANTKLVATSWDSNESYTPSGNGIGYLTDIAAGDASVAGGSGWANLTEDQTAFAAGIWNGTASASPAVDDWAIQLVALTPTAPVIVNVNGSGNYSFGGLANGSYTVTPSEPGFTFAPASLPVTINVADVNNANFTAASQTFSVSGTISPPASGSGATVTLSGAASAVATADSSGNYSFGGLANGSYTVTPTKAGLTFTPASQPATVNGANITNLNFTVPQLSSIAVTPVNPSIAKGKTQQFTATGTFSDGSTQNLSSTATWSSSAASVATINMTGLATAVGFGSTTIQATSGAISGNTSLTVTTATLASIAVTPINPSIAKGTTQQFAATGTFSDGSTQNLSSTATWSSSAATVATINTTGLATAVGVGSTTIKATSGAISGSTSLTVTAATLASIAVTPANPSIAKGSTQQFTATGTFSDGSTQNLSSTATWNSSAATVATINTTGLATAVGVGSTTIQATSGAISGSTSLTVTAATLASIAVTPINPSIAKGSTQQFTATGTFSDGSTQNLSSTATWSSSALGVATINTTGLATAVGVGSTTIQATSGAISGSTSLTVTAATLASIAVTPINPSIAKGSTQQFTATGTFSDGSTQNLSSTATWSSSAATVATINTTGLATAVGVGSTTIQATSGAISGSTSMTVTAATLSSIAVTPVNPSIAKGSTQQFTATGTFSDGSTQNLSSTATWSSSAATIATINTSGLATAVGVGSTTIKATSGAISGSTSLTVMTATLASIAVTPVNPSIAKGSTQQFTATGTFSDGSTQNLSSTATWNSSAVGVATINTTGLATAAGAGSTTIQATSGAISGSTSLTVTAATLASIAVTPINPSIAKGSTQQFTATGTFSDGSTQNLSSTVTWGSSTVSVATINTAGLATAVGFGSTTIQATSGAISGSTSLTVTAATLASIAVTPVNPSIAKGSTQQFTATGTFSDGSTQNLTSTATWSSSTATVATINTAGLATAVGVGSTTIRATLGALVSSTTLTVNGGVPLLVRSGNGSSATGNRSGNVSFNASGAAGDTIVLFVRFGGTTISSVTDNQAGGSNNYVSVLGPTKWGVVPNVTDRWAQVFVAKNIRGGSRLTIKVSLAGSSTHDIYMAALEYSGVDPVNPINATASGVGTVGSNGAPTTPNVTTSVANTKLVATSWDSNESYNSTGNGNGYTTDSAAGVPSISGGTGWANLTEDRTAVTAGTWSATAKSTRAVVDWVIQLIALAPAATGQ